MRLDFQYFCKFFFAVSAAQEIMSIKILCSFLLKVEATHAASVVIRVMLAIFSGLNDIFFGNCMQPSMLYLYIWILWQLVFFCVLFALLCYHCNLLQQKLQAIPFIFTFKQSASHPASQSASQPAIRPKAFYSTCCCKCCVKAKEKHFTLECIFISATFGFLNAFCFIEFEQKIKPKLRQFLVAADLVGWGVIVEFLEFGWYISCKQLLC